MKNIICGIDDKYYQHCGAMLVSLFKHNDDTFHVYILSLELTGEHKKLLKELVESYHNHVYIIDVDRKLIENFPMKDTDYPSLATYLRLFIPQLLPLNVEKALYIDSDIIFNGDISDLYNCDIANYALAGMEDAPHRQPERLGYPIEDLYFNAGFLLLNIKYLRDINFVDMALSYIRDCHHKIVLHDQDVLNALLHGRVRFVPIKWNMLDCFYKNPPFISEKHKSELDTSRKSPVTIHFSGPLKPWHHGCLHPLREEYFKYSKLIPWGCKKKQYSYVFTVYRFPASLFVWLGATPERAIKISRKLGFKMRKK